MSPMSLPRKSSGLNLFEQVLCIGAPWVGEGKVGACTLYSFWWSILGHSSLGLGNGIFLKIAFLVIEYLRAYVMCILVFQ